MLIGFATAMCFLILSIFLFHGKGKWLIAGFNTLSEQDKKQYDDKKMCKAVGVLCLVCSVMICALLYFGYRVDSGMMEEKQMLVFALIFIAVILTTIILVGTYISKKAKK